MITGVTDTAIEVAGRRLNPQVLPEWQLLLTHIEISEGFSFVVLLVPDADWADACRLALSHSLDAQSKSLLTVNFSDPEDFKAQLPSRLLDLYVSDRTGAVWLEKTVSEASPYFVEWQDAWRGLVARLNQFRNSLRRHFKVPLIFVGANWIQPLIRENAPDLWSARTLVTRVFPLEELGVPTDQNNEQRAEGLAIDPDFALRNAARLRGQSGKELSLAQILYRAGLALLARSRWIEAETVLSDAIDLQRRFHAPDEGMADTLRLLGFSLERQSKFPEATAVVQKARELYIGANNVLREIECLRRLGDIAVRRSDYVTGDNLYEKALERYRSVGDMKGEADCVFRLGDIAMRHSDYMTAQARFAEALPLYQRVGNVLGEANCIKALGDIALRRSDYGTAEARFVEVLPLYRRLGNVLGEANCIARLGIIALRRSDYSTAQARFAEALPLYQRVGSGLGEANCISNLGDVAMGRSNYVDAEARYMEALPIYRRAGNILGEANCIQSLGDIAVSQGLSTKAQQKFLQALELYQRIAEPYSIGWSHLRLAHLEQDSTVQQEHLKAAREAWSQIHRPDLIAELEEEFKTTEGKDATHH